MNDDKQAGGLDLDAIEARSAASVEAEGTRGWHAAIGATADDVPALVAEVRRLRERVAELELDIECAEGDAREMGYLASDGGW